MNDADMQEGIIVKGFGSYEGMTGKIIRVCRTTTGSTSRPAGLISYFLLKVIEPGKYYVRGEELDLSNPACWDILSSDGPNPINQGKVEKPCRLPTCRRPNYTDAKKCWWCGEANPTETELDKLRKSKAR